MNNCKVPWGKFKNHGFELLIIFPNCRLLVDFRNNEMGRTDSTGWNKKVVPKARTASHSTDIVGNGSGETVQHNDILSEIQQLRKQINDIKEKKNMKSTPLPVSLTSKLEVY